MSIKQFLNYPLFILFSFSVLLSISSFAELLITESEIAEIDSLKLCCDWRGFGRNTTPWFGDRKRGYAAIKRRKTPLTISVFIHSFEGMTESLEASLLAYCDMISYFKWSVNLTLFTASEVDALDFPCSFNSIQIVRRKKSFRNRLSYVHRRYLFNTSGLSDVYIVTEDDILITFANILGFLRQVEILPQPYIPGFIRFEKTSSKQIAFKKNGKDWSHVRKCDKCNQSLQSVDSVRVMTDFTHKKYCNLGGGIPNITIDGRLYLGHCYSGAYMVTNAHLDYLKKFHPWFRSNIPNVPRAWMREYAVADIFWRCNLTSVVPLSDYNSFMIQHTRGTHDGDSILEPEFINQFMPYLLT